MEKQAAPLVIIIGDGLGDRPVPELGGKTPLEAADTPYLDWVAAHAECGLMDPIAPGIRAGSDTAHLAILGYDPYEVYTGRGPFEATGIGMEVKPGDVAFRCNFTTVDENMTVLDRRAGRIEHGTDALAEAVNGMQIEDVTCFVKASVAHRAALVLRGPGLSADVTDVDPHETGVKLWECKPTSPEGEKTARIVNEFVKRSYELLNDHPVNQQRRQEGKLPANVLVPRGVGGAPHLESLEEQYGFKGACIVEVGLIKGIGRYLQMYVPDVEGATGGLDTDPLALADAVNEALDEYGLILCNLKAPDLAGHDSKPDVKVQTAKMLDALVGRCLDKIKETGAYLVVTADHSTPVSVGDHSGDPVPIMFYGPDVRVDSVNTFGERACAAGIIGRIRGRDIVPILTQFNNTQHKFGA